MKKNTSGDLRRKVALSTFFLAAVMGFAVNAQARDNLSWSLGMGSPGVGLSVGNAGPVFVPTQPVYVQPAPMYRYQQPVDLSPPRYFRAPPEIVYLQPEYHEGSYRRHQRSHDHDDEGDQD